MKNIAERYLSYEENHSCFFIGGLLAGAGALGGGVLGFLGSQQASQAQTEAEQQALAFQQQVYGNTQQNLLPFLRGGTQAWEELLRHLGTPGQPGVLTESPAKFGNLPYPTAATFKQSPGYQFQLQQGTQAIRDAGAGVGGTLNGNMLKSLQTYGTGLANQDWYNYLNEYWNRYNAASQGQQNLFNRFAGIGQAGQQAANTQGQQGTAFAGLIGNTLGNIGASQAAGILGQYGSIANTLTPNNLQMLYNTFSGGGGSGPSGFVMPGGTTPFGGATSIGSTSSYLPQY